LYFVVFVCPVSFARLGFLTLYVKAEMVGHYLAEFAMTYKPTRHGRPGVGGNKFVPLK
jgi:small subunit ribosomal protein S15e